MRIRELSVSGLVVLATLGGGSTVGDDRAVADVPLHKSVGAQLPVDDFRDIELDEARDRLYIAQGSGAGLPLVITDLDGQLTTEVDAITDVSDVVLSDDGGTLLATQGYARVIAIDAESLTVNDTYPAPDGACVTSVEPTGNKVVAGFVDCGLGSGGLLVWTSPALAPVVFTDGPDYNPIIDAAPGAPGLLVAGDTGISPVTTYVIDVSGTDPDVIARRHDTGSNLKDYAVSPDGTQVVQSVGNPYEHRAYQVPDLSDAVTYPSGVYPEDAAWSGDGSTVAIGRDRNKAHEADVYLYAKGSTSPDYVVDFDGANSLWRGTLLVNEAGTRAWAVTSADSYGDTQLLHSFGPDHPPVAPITDLDVTAVTGSGKDKKTASVTVTWSSPTGDGHYWWITAATDGGAEREIWRSTMDPSGEHSLTYELPKGVTTFTVRYQDYDDWYPAGHATATVTR